MDQLLDSAQPQIAVPKSQADSLWYKDALIYEVHVRAFYDSNNDGVGDFPGLTLDARSSFAISRRFAEGVFRSAP